MHELPRLILEVKKGVWYGNSMDRGKRQIYHFVKHNHKKYPLNMFVAHLIRKEPL